MNQLVANQLNEEGAIVLILNMQKGAEIGLDYNSWLVGPEFMGFKMINPGFHCLFFRYALWMESSLVLSTVNTSFLCERFCPFFWNQRRFMCILGMRRKSSLLTKRICLRKR